MLRWSKPEVSLVDSRLLWDEPGGRGASTEPRWPVWLGVSHGRISVAFASTSNQSIDRRNAAERSFFFLFGAWGSSALLGALHCIALARLGGLDEPTRPGDFLSFADPQITHSGNIYIPERSDQLTAVRNAR